MGRSSATIFCCKWRYLYASIHPHISKYVGLMVFTYFPTFGVQGFWVACLGGVWSLELGLCLFWRGVSLQKLEGQKQHRDYIGAILGLHWGNIGIMEKKMETTGIIGFIP